MKWAIKKYLNIDILFRVSVSPSVRHSFSPSVRQSASPPVRQSVCPSVQSLSEPSPGSGLVYQYSNYLPFIPVHCSQYRRYSNVHTVYIVQVVHCTVYTVSSRYLSAWHMVERRNNIIPVDVLADVVVAGVGDSRLKVHVAVHITNVYKSTI